MLNKARFTYLRQKRREGLNQHFVEQIKGIDLPEYTEISLNRHFIEHMEGMN